MKEQSKAVLLAPNGNPSNLTPEQYKLVRTPSFKAWFGDWENAPETASKVIDENGEPMVVYHHASTKFYHFNQDKQLIGWLGRGIYFSNNKKEFKEYGKVLLSVFLNIRKLFKVVGEGPSDIISEVKQLSNERDNDLDVSKTLKQNNYNGILFKHWDRGTIISCFESEQIKLSDGSNTTFDANSPDIRFAEGGKISALLAPNGKPSNLTPEQYKIVRTPAFKAWFGDWENAPETASKVVDENGEPLAVYHGTDYEFTVFEKAKGTIGAYGQGFYFTNDERFASNYARKTGRILKFFLNIKKIFEIDNDEMPIGYSKYSTMLNNKGLSRDFTKKIIAENFDGVYAKNKYNENEIVAFYPEQIKLADGSNAAFDAANPDIRFDEGGEIETADKILLAPDGSLSLLPEKQYEIVHAPAFKKWFGDWEKAFITKDYTGVSKAIHDNGEPMLLYHQTSIESAQNLMHEGVWDFNRMSNRKGDEMVPDGIFLKPDAKDIGVSGKKSIQMMFFANIKNPLEVMNRTELRNILKANIANFDEIGYQIWEIDTQYHNEYKKVDAEYKEQYKINKSKGLKDDQILKDINKKYSEALSGLSDISNHWKIAAAEKAAESRELINQFLKKNNYDGLFLWQDTGSFNRVTVSIVALQSNQVKLADGTNNTFDMNNEDIRYEHGGRILTNDGFLLKKLDNLTLIMFPKGNIIYHGQIEFENGVPRAIYINIFRNNKAKISKLLRPFINIEEPAEIAEFQLMYPSDSIEGSVKQYMLGKIDSEVMADGGEITVTANLTDDIIEQMRQKSIDRWKRVHPELEKFIAFDIEKDNLIKADYIRMKETVEKVYCTSQTATDYLFTLTDEPRTTEFYKKYGTAITLTYNGRSYYSTILYELIMAGSLKEKQKIWKKFGAEATEMEKKVYEFLSRPDVCATYNNALNEKIKWIRTRIVKRQPAAEKAVEDFEKLQRGLNPNIRQAIDEISEDWRLQIRDNWATYYSSIIKDYRNDVSQKGTSDIDDLYPLISSPNAPLSEANRELRYNLMPFLEISYGQYFTDPNKGYQRQRIVSLLKSNHAKLVEDRAEQKSILEISSFRMKMYRKLSDIFAMRPGKDVAVNKWSNSTMKENSITFTFSDGVTFTVNNTIKINYSKFGTPFYQYPTTFHNFLLADQTFHVEIGENELKNILSKINN